MSSLQQVRELLSEMSAQEKIQLLRWIANDLSDSSTGVERTPGICGGAPRIAGTRIPIWSLVQYRNIGASEIDILRAFPALRAEDLANAWDFYRNHKREIDEQIRVNEAA